MTKLLSTILLSLFTVAMLPGKIEEESIPLVAIPLTPRQAIIKYAQIYAAPENLLVSMATCESQLNKNPKGDYKGGIWLAQGLFQYHKETWDRHTALMGEKLDRFSYQDQARLVAWIAANRPDLLREWTSYRAIKNGGTYTFYSKLLGKSITVECKVTV